MVLVVADDLLFRSKISTVAKRTGVVIRAATTAEAAMATDDPRTWETRLRNTSSSSRKNGCCAAS